MKRSAAVVFLLAATAHGQTIVSVAGHSDGDGLVAAAAKLSPAAIGCGSGGQWLAVGDERAFQVRVVSLTGGLTQTYPVAAGSPFAGVAVAPDGVIYASDPYMARVWRLPAGGGPATVYAGTGASGFSGDGGPATGAQLNSPTGLALDALGNLFIADTANQRVRRVDAATRTIATYAGGNVACADGVCDGGAPTSARLSQPMGVAVDDLTGDLYIAERLGQRVRAVRRAAGTISTVAGTGAVGLTGDGGLATLATLTQPSDVAVGPDGSLYIADTRNHAVRRVRPSGIIERVAGTGQAGAGADGQAITSRLDSPRTVEWCGGKLYVGEQGGSMRIRAVDVGVEAPTATVPPTGTPTQAVAATHTPRPTSTMTVSPTRTLSPTPTCGCCSQCA